MRRLVATLVLGLASTAVSQSPEPLPAYRARLLGVYNAQTGDPVAGAEVIDLFSKTKAVTTATGTVTLAFLPDGGSMVRVQKIGFEPFTQIVAISPGDTLPAMILLRPAGVQTLPAVVTKDSAPRYVSPALRAFEERRKMGVGRFVSGPELRKSDNRKMTDVVRGLGVQVLCAKTFPQPCYAVSHRLASKNAMGTSGCPLEVYVDGVRIVNQDARDLQMIPVNEMGGVEAYFGPASIPTEFNMTGSSCGVILFWSRER